MGEAKRRQKLDPNWGKQNKVKKLDLDSDVWKKNQAESLAEYVEKNTALKGRGYLACAHNGCIYYGEEDFLGDEDDLLKESVRTYQPDKEVVLVRQLVKGEAVFANEVVPLESLSDY